MALPPLRSKRVAWIQLSDAETQQMEQDAMVLKAIENGDTDTILKSGLKGGDALNIADEMNASAVHKATKCSTTEILQYLIDSGAYIAFPDRDGAQPIAHAIRADNTEALKLLMSIKKPDGTRFIDLSQTISLSGHTLLHECAWFGRIDCARVLLETGDFKKEKKEYIVQANKAGQSAMHVAAFRATPAFIQLLVDHGGSIDKETTNPKTKGETAAKVAETMGKAANVKLLNDLNTAMNSIKFAARMKAKRSQQAKRSQPLAPIVRLRFEYDLQLFTADLEKSFLVSLARHAGVEPMEMHVLSRTAGSVILDIEIRAKKGSEVAAKVLDTGLDGLSKVVGYPMLACERVAATDKSKGTPGYNALEVMSSPAANRSGN